MKILIFLSALLFSVSCKDTKYAYFYEHKIPELVVDKRIYPISLIEDNNIDIIMLIDNSGSMYKIQQNIINNSKIFFEQFAKQSNINWKIGLISTDKADAPYLGFDKPFDWNLIDFNDPTSLDRAVSQFQTAVSKFGTSGSSNEYVYHNIKRNIDLYDGKTPGRPAFLRPNSHLVVIMISDEEEQSAELGPLYEAPAFYKAMNNYVAGNKVLRFYGALGMGDLEGCDTPGDRSTYAGSSYETIINLTHGFNISACIPDFGTHLAKIGKDIASLVTLPSLLLKERPIVATLKVYYKDQLLSPGPKELGGKWFYEEKTNTINFYSMAFVKDPHNDTFKIEFDIDDGNH